MLSSQSLFNYYWDSDFSAKFLFIFFSMRVKRGTFGSFVWAADIYDVNQVDSSFIV